MLIRIPTNVVEAALAVHDNSLLRKSKEGSLFKRFVETDADLLDRKTLKALLNASEGKSAEYVASLQFAYSAATDKTGDSLKITCMEQVESALKNFIVKTRIKGYVFVRRQFNAVAPLLVTSIEQEKDRYRNRPDLEYGIRIVVSLAYSTLQDPNSSKSFSVSAHTLAGIFANNDVEYEEEWKGKKDNPRMVNVKAKGEGYVTAEQIFRAMGYYRETKELHELYDSQIERFFKFLKMYGQQFRVKGSASSSSYWWSHNTSMLTEGKPSRCIQVTVPAVCRKTDEGEDSRSRSRYRSDYDDDDGESAPLSNDMSVALDDVTLEDLQAEVEVMLTGVKEVSPLQPTVRIFHLEQHEEFTVHVNNVTPYKYKDNLQDNLILPKEVKDLTQMLVAAASEDVEDVIEGKSQSTVIAAVGDPGLGKTLMAEVMSEACKKPLYKIQAAQLGDNPSSLESNLVKILRRAERWNCVVMIDEANAYIHSRGHDIGQNAVVGVFLRKLEYFKGILILTTNKTRGDDEGTDFDIDDAILSRCTAVFRFELPDSALSKDLWRLQAKLLNVELSEDLIKSLVKRFHISGRTIRHLLKLSARWAALKNEALSLDHFVTCSQYVPLTQSENVNVKEKNQ